MKPINVNLSKFTFYLLITLLHTSCSISESNPIRIGTNVWIGYEPLYLARNLGSFNELPVNLVQMTSSRDVQRAFQNGLIDCAAVTIDEMLSLIQNHCKVKVLFIMDVSNGADAILCKPEIKKARDLKGKRVGLETNSVGAYLLTRFLEIEKMDVADLDIVPVFVEDHKNTFLKNKVDAIVTFEPVNSILVDAGANILFDSKKIPDEIMDILIVRADFYEENKVQLEKLTKIWYETLDYMNDKNHSSAEFVSQRIGLTLDQYTTSLIGIKQLNKIENDKYFANKFMSNVHKMMEYMLKNKLLKHHLNIDNVLVSSK